MKNYNDLLAEIEKLFFQTDTSCYRTILVIEQTLTMLELSLQDKKMNSCSDHSGNILESFFGNSDLKDCEKKLRILRNKLRELNKISNLQQVF